MIKGAIFDADGVLLDSMPAWENLGEIYLRSQGIQAEEGLGEILFPMSMEESADYLISHYGLNRTAAEVIEGVTLELRRFYEEEVPLKEGVREYLLTLAGHGIPMSIATAGDRHNAEAALERLGVLPYFHEILTCSQVGSGKDKPAVYLAAAAGLGVSPAAAWVFEDSLHAIRTAKEAGFRTAGVYDRANLADLPQIRKEADIYLPSFSDFTFFWEKAAE